MTRGTLALPWPQYQEKLPDFSRHAGTGRSQDESITCSSQAQLTKPLVCFFERILQDPRIGTTHIALYAALYQRWVGAGGMGPVQAYSHELMPLAKILSTATYHRVLRDLDAYWYVRYEPSYSRLRRSRIFLAGRDSP